MSKKMNNAINQIEEGMGTVVGWSFGSCFNDNRFN